MVLLASILGQPRAVELLRRMRTSGKLPHALLFAGPPGVGKATCAVALAAALNCENGEGCTACGPCAKIAQGIHPDVTTLRPQGAGNVHSIEAVRELATRLAFPPHEGKARVVVIEDADRMTPEGANAFLKTLEEPPGRTFFILCSAAPDRMLITILSRCQRVRFAPLPTDAVARILDQMGIDAERARPAAELSGGSATRAAELADGEVLQQRQKRARALVAAAQAHGFKPISDAAAELAQAKDEIAPTLDVLALLYRDAMSRAAGAGGVPDELLDNEVQRARGGAGVLARRAASILEAQTALTGYGNAQLVLENLILGLREAR